MYYNICKLSQCYGLSLLLISANTDNFMNFLSYTYTYILSFRVLESGTGTNIFF